MGGKREQVHLFSNLPLGFQAQSSSKIFFTPSFEIVAVIKYVLGVGTEHIKLIHIAQDLEPILSTSS